MSDQIEIINPRWPSKATRSTPREQAEGQAFVNYADRVPWGWNLAHVQNEQTSGKVSHGAFKRSEGVRKGFPDYVLEMPAWGWCGLRIELKRVAGSRTTPEQLSWQHRLITAGYLSVIAPGAMCAVGWCNWYASSYGRAWTPGPVRAIPLELPTEQRRMYRGNHQPASRTRLDLSRFGACG